MVLTHVTSLSATQVVTAIQGLIDAADEQLKKRTVDDEDQVSTKASVPLPRRTPPSVAVDGKCNILDMSLDSLQTPKENPAETTTTEEKDAEDNNDEQQTVKVFMLSWRVKRLVFHLESFTPQILGMEQTSTYEGGKKWNPANRPVPAPKSNPEVSLCEIVSLDAFYISFFFTGPRRDSGSAGYLFRRHTSARVANPSVGLGGAIRRGAQRGGRRRAGHYFK